MAPGEGRQRPVEHASHLERENRFVVRARLADGRQVRAYLPNTARLAEVLVPGAHLTLEPTDDPRRSTGWTVARVWDGTWVALQASAAADLVAGHLRGGGALPGWSPPLAVRREVTAAGHRLDLAIDLPTGATALVEVKSLSRAHGRVAPLSATPSRRGAAQLDALGAVAAAQPVAVVFVVQRGDVDVLSLSAAADPGWVAAVRRARQRGVHVVAYACEVGPAHLRLDRALPVRDAEARDGVTVPSS